VKNRLAQSPKRFGAAEEGEQKWTKQGRKERKEQAESRMLSAIPCHPHPASPSHQRLHSRAGSPGVSSPLVRTEEAGMAAERQVPELWGAEVFA